MRLRLMVGWVALGACACSDLLGMDNFSFLGSSGGVSAVSGASSSAFAAVEFGGTSSAGDRSNAGTTSGYGTGGVAGASGGVGGAMTGRTTSLITVGGAPTGGTSATIEMGGAGGALGGSSTATDGMGGTTGGSSTATGGMGGATGGSGTTSSDVGDASGGNSTATGGMGGTTGGSSTTSSGVGGTTGGMGGTTGSSGTTSNGVGGTTGGMGGTTGGSSTATDGMGGTTGGSGTTSNGVGGTTGGSSTATGGMGGATSGGTSTATEASGVGGATGGGGTTGGIGGATGGVGDTRGGTGPVINADPTQCPSPLQWHDLQYYANSTGRAVAIPALAGGIAVIENSGVVACPAALIATNLAISIDCKRDKSETLNFGSWRADPQGRSPSSQTSCDCFDESGSRYNLHCGCSTIDQTQYPVVPWSRRRLKSGEPISLISFDADGMAIAARSIAPPHDIFASPVEPSTDAAKVSLVFGEDAQLIGFCGRGECDNLANCTSIDSMIDDSPFQLHWRYGTRNPFFADISGDGRADAVTARPDFMDTYGQVTDSLTGLLGAATSWTIQTIGGDEQTLLSDIDGDAKADFVSINVAGRHLTASNTLVSLSLGDRFDSPAVYYSGEIKGTAELYTGNVDGVPGDEIVTVGGGQVLVYRASGNLFLAPQLWGAYDNSTPLVAAAIADVTGDGSDDVVLIRDTQLEVMASTGISFTEATVWLANVTYGSPGWFFPRLRSANRADAIFIDSTQSIVYFSEANRFTKPDTAFAPIAIGERGNFYADVTGDGLDDAIVLDHQAAWVYPSRATDFGVPVRWHAGPL